MCSLCQIVGDSDPKILDTADVFEDRSLQRICSMDLFFFFFLLFFFPFTCYLHHIAFDRLKSHTPIFLPASLSEVSMCPLYM